MVNEARPSAHRCSTCDVNWPPSAPYAEACPTCGGPTWRAAGEEPLTEQQAIERTNRGRALRKAHEDFNRYYAEREAENAARAVEDFLATL